MIIGLFVVVFVQNLFKILFLSRLHCLFALVFALLLEQSVKQTTREAVRVHLFRDV